jgi:hypothetical protein
MTEQNTQAERVKDSPKLTPDFRHRLCDDDATSVNLVDSVLTLADQANNLLVLVQNQFIDEDDEDRSRLADRVIFHSLDAVCGLIKDIEAIVNAYHEADRETKTSQ